MNVLRGKIKKAIALWHESGFTGFRQYSFMTLINQREKLKYQKWIRKFDTLTAEKRRKIQQKIKLFKYRPLISILMPVYNVEEKWLRLCIESVLRQLYENWEFCIADDYSLSPHIRRVLEEYAEKDSRVKIVFRAANGHISAASNSALEMATGEFIALLDHDDELAEHALYYVAREINNFPEAGMIYSDEDLIDEKGKRYAPKFKPDWSRDLFYSLNLITHLSVYRASVLQKIGGFRVGFEGSQDYDLALRVTEEIPENHIRHIPRILYHWRAIKGSVALGSEEKPYAHVRARLALRTHFERIGKKAEVSEAVCNLHRIRYELPVNLPKVSLILLIDEDTTAAKKAIETFTEETVYQNFEIVLICSETVKMKIEAENFLPDIKIIVSQSTSEAGKYNSAVSQTDGEVLCFVDANLKPQSKDWLKEMTSFAFQKEIGAVGAKILYADNTILHGGLIVGAGDSVGIAHHHTPREEGGYFFRARLVNNFSAVSVSCLAARREVFQAVGGFDAENYSNNLFDADFCLRLREKNYRIVFTPYAELVQLDEKKTVEFTKKSIRRREKLFCAKVEKTYRTRPVL